MPTLKYRLSTRVSNGMAEVLARFVGGKDFSQRAKTRIFVPAAAWDNTVGNVIVPKKISPNMKELLDCQQRLNDLRNYLFEIWWEQQYEATDGWLQRSIDLFANIRISHDDRLTLEHIVRRFAKEHPMEESTRKVFVCIADIIGRMAANGHPIYADSISGKDISSLEEYMRHETRERNGKTVTVERGPNTIVSRMRKLRTACNWAESEELIRQSPFGDKKGQYKVGAEKYGDPFCLTIDERDHLYHFDGLPDYLAKQRDIFVFQCHVGCRVGDLILFTPDNITSDGFLQYIPRKTSKVDPKLLRIPLSRDAIEIIERYKDTSGGKLLPFTHPNKYCAYVHEILKRAGIDRKVLVLNKKTLQPEMRPLYEVGTTHTGRKTCAQHVFNETKSTLITAAFTGHSENSTEIKRYATVTDEIMVSVMESINKSVTDKDKPQK